MEEQVKDGRHSTEPTGRKSFTGLSRRWSWMLSGLLLLFLAMSLALLLSSTSSAGLMRVPEWVGARQDTTSSVAWGDYDNDGDQDLLAVTYTHHYAQVPHRLYENRNGRLTREPVWEGMGNPATWYARGGQWGDIDGNGWLDVVTVSGAFGNETPAVYLNFDGVLSTEPDWTTVGAGEAVAGWTPGARRRARRRLRARGAPAAGPTPPAGPAGAAGPGRRRGRRPAARHR